eukprot:1160547-Pelagomonas_calceolata.AAC.5
MNAVDGDTHMKETLWMVIFVWKKRCEWQHPYERNAVDGDTHMKKTLWPRSKQRFAGGSIDDQMHDCSQKQRLGQATCPRPSTILFIKYHHDTGSKGQSLLETFLLSEPLGLFKIRFQQSGLGWK